MINIIITFILQASPQNLSFGQTQPQQQQQPPPAFGSPSQGLQLSLQTICIVPYYRENDSLLIQRFTHVYLSGLPN